MILRFSTVTNHPAGRQRSFAVRSGDPIARVDAGNGILRVVAYCR